MTQETYLIDLHKTFSEDYKKGLTVEQYAETNNMTTIHAVRLLELAKNVYDQSKIKEYME